MATYFQWLKADFGFKRGAGQALHLQPAAVPRRQEERDAGLRDVGAVRHREAGQASSRRSSCSPTKGFSTYSTLIETRRELVEKKPDLVQRFVDASIIGWYNYIYGDNTAANALHQARQPGDDRRAARLFRRQDEGVRHRRFRRRAHARHRRHDRRAHAGFLRQDGARRRRQSRVSTTANPTRCNSSTRRSGSICGRSNSAADAADG